MWSKGSKIIFLKNGFTDFEDAFIGFGTIKKTFEPFELEFVERQMCVENTYCKKIVFGKLVKFLPELSINDNQIAHRGKGVHYCTGVQISDSEIPKIERLVTMMIT